MTQHLVGQRSWDLALTNPGVLLSRFQRRQGFGRRQAEDTARPSPGETKESQMSIWITSNKIKVSSGYIASHALRSLPCDRCKVSSKASSPESETWCFPFQIPVAYVVFKVIQQLLTSSYLSPHPFLSFKSVFQKPVPTQNVINLCSLPSCYCMQNVPFFLDSV